MSAMKDTYRALLGFLIVVGLAGLRLLKFVGIVLLVFAIWVLTRPEFWHGWINKALSWTIAGIAILFLILGLAGYLNGGGSDPMGPDFDMDDGGE